MFREKLLTLWSQIKSNPVAATLGIVGVLLILIGFVTLIVSSGERENIDFEQATASASASIFFDIQGAVVNPGVYEASADTRLINALVLAGGLSATADREWVARNLNLATKLKDGAKVYIPTVGEPARSAGGSVGQKTQSISGSENQIIGISEGLININTATIGELDKLPGIGPVTGQKIIDNRPYADNAELLTKKIVGKKVFDQIKEKITTY